MLINNNHTILLTIIVHIYLVKSVYNIDRYLIVKMEIIQCHRVKMNEKTRFQNSL
jgi:hypothetical protein